jgi:hypothetical protein
MIEILGDSLDNIILNGYDWLIYVNEKEYINSELCDALWEAVKEVL